MELCAATYAKNTFTLLLNAMSWSRLASYQTRVAFTTPSKITRRKRFGYSVPYTWPRYVP